MSDPHYIDVLLRKSAPQHDNEKNMNVTPSYVTNLLYYVPT